MIVIYSHHPAQECDESTLVLEDELYVNTKRQREREKEEEEVEDEEVEDEEVEDEEVEDEEVEDEGDDDAAVNTS
jgi:hypothetical protein